MIGRLHAVLARYPELAAAYLFGSTARGTAGPESDVDVGLVFKERGVGSRENFRLIADLASRLEAGTAPRPVDVVALEDQGAIFCHRVLLEGRRIFEGDRKRRIDFESDTIVRALDFRPTYDLAIGGRLAGLRRWLSQRRP